MVICPDVRTILCGLAACTALSCSSPALDAVVPAEPVAAPAPVGTYARILGVAQDAGHPQAGCTKSCCVRAWADPALRHRPASMGLVDGQTGKRWLFEATPAFADQLHDLADDGVVDGIFITHAHIGHYAGLVHLGREVMGARGQRVYAMPRLAGFLRSHGPWSELVELGNIDLVELAEGEPVKLGPSLTVTPFLVPHRDEFSETVGFEVQGPERSVVWLPDIDKWELWQTPLEQLVERTDYALLDATFYADGEISRPMSEVPHPFVVETMSRLQDQPAEQRAKVHFVHFNHTNPVLDAESMAHKAVLDAGFKVAKEGQILPL